MAALSRERARKVIVDIRIENGGITPEDRERTPESVLRTIESLRRKVAAATRTYDLFSTHALIICLAEDL
jgi:hypothetical protein